VRGGPREGEEEEEEKGERQDGRARMPIIESMHQTFNLRRH
jgi:hypothetical protein